MAKWWMCNVVWYDGSDAFVSKFVLQADDEGITEDSKRKVRTYLDGNGEVILCGEEMNKGDEYIKIAEYAKVKILNIN